MTANTNRLSSRTRTLNFFRKIFILPFPEKLLVKLIEKRPQNSFLRKLQPNNYLYQSPSIRKVNRWGINFELDISDYQEWLIYYISKEDSSFGVLNYLNEGDHVIDIGGNIGQTGLSIAKKVGNSGSVISFEPYPPTFTKYQKNLSLNPNFKSIIKLENKGLGMEEAKMTMFKACLTNSGSNRVTANGNQNPDGLMDVSITTLDKYVREKNLSKIDFIKIDVEGFEFNVLKGAQASIVQHRPRLYIEMNDSNLRDQGGSSKELLNWLFDLGYKITRVDTGNPISEKDYNSDEHYDIYCNNKEMSEKS